jgi:AcrR family transcriptional regulator
VATREERSRPTRDSPAVDRPHAQLADVQRARIVAGATEAVAELGYGGLTVAAIIARARVSRRTFYEIFDDREACFLAAFDVALARVAEPALAGYRREGVWRERVAAALAATLALFDEQPALGRLLVLDALAAGPRALARRAAVLDALVCAVDEGRASGRGRDPGPLAAEAVVGAVLAVLHARLLEASRKPLLALAGPLMSTIVLPYLGAAAAERELQRPPPRVARGARATTAGGDRNGHGRPRANPLHGLNMRLTYRTLRVLSAVAELGARGLGGLGSPPSNREVADAAGIVDQGQMSKLLARLQSLGLIENHGRGRPSGERNAWKLTACGAEVVESIRERPALG